MNSPIDKLKPHPLNAQIYDDGADENFVESVRELGILAPLLIDKKDRIISGHRRWEAATKAGLKLVPVEVFSSEDELDIRGALVEANRQRVKTNEQIAREAAEVYEIEKTKARERQRQGGSRKQLPVNLPEGGDARDVAGKRVGMSGKKVEQAVQVVKTITSLEEEGRKDEAEKLRDQLNTYTISRAHKVAKESGHLKVAADEQTADEDNYVSLLEWKGMSEDKKKEFLTCTYPRAQFNRQTDDSIEWAQFSWNPITGCSHGCDYCYARDIANRLFPAKFVPVFYPGRLQAPKHTVRPMEAKSEIGFKNVFTCSMSDLFGKWVPSDLIQLVLNSVAENPDWNFLFLTKFPQRYAEFKFPDNAWVGTSVDTQARVAAAEKAFKDVRAKVKWLSCEPMLERLTFKHLDLFDWVVMGGASRSTETPESRPDREWVSHLWAQAREAGCKIYEKPNLLERCREYPYGSKH